MTDNFRDFSNNQQMIAHMRKLAKQSRTTTQIILEEYTLDDFIQRIAKSRYKNNLILTGGFLLASLVGINNRTTEDIDTDIKGRNLNLSEVTKMIDEICAISPVPNDPIIFNGQVKLQNYMKERLMLAIVYIYWRLSIIKRKQILK